MLRTGPYGDLYQFAVDAPCRTARGPSYAVPLVVPRSRRISVVQVIPSLPDGVKYSVRCCGACSGSVVPPAHTAAMPGRPTFTSDQYVVSPEACCTW